MLGNPLFKKRKSGASLDEIASGGGAAAAAGGTVATVPAVPLTQPVFTSQVGQLNLAKQ